MRPNTCSGFSADVEMNATLNLALQLHPDTQRVVVVGGASALDASWVELARQNFHADEGKVEFVYLTGLPMTELLHQVAQLPEKTVVLYLQILRDGKGDTFLPRDALNRLSQARLLPPTVLVTVMVGVRVTYSFNWIAPSPFTSLVVAA